MFDFIYNKRREFADKYNALKDDYFTLLELSHKFQEKEAKFFKGCSKTLNDVIDSLTAYEHNYAETKENFINNCKERRSSMNKERDDIIYALVALEKINIKHQDTKGLEESKRL